MIGTQFLLAEYVFQEFFLLEPNVIEKYVTDGLLSDKDITM